MVYANGVSVSVHCYIKAEEPINAFNGNYQDD